MEMTFEEFTSFYLERGYLPNDIGHRKNKLNEKQLKSRYEKYLKSEQKKRDAQDRHTSKDNKWEELKSHLDLNVCSLHIRLSENSLHSAVRDLYENAGYYLETIDPAHVFGKGSYPHMKYDLDNVVPLNRYSHSMLDQSRDPITGEQVSKEYIEGWWRFIVGNEKYEELLQRSKN